MTTPATPGDPGKDATPLRPTMTAEQVLARLLELIRGSQYLSDFTTERMNQVMGVEFVTYRPGYQAFGEQVTTDWWYSLEKEDDDQYGPQFTLRFTPGQGKDANSVSMTDVCQLDLDRFSAELEAMGFSKTPHYDSAPPAPPPPFPGHDARPEHGGLMDYTFHRVKDGKGEMTVIVYPEAEQAASNHLCVRMIQIF